MLLTHAKCMKEDILSAWKRVDTKMKLKKSFLSANFNDSSDNNYNMNSDENASNTNENDDTKDSENEATTGGDTSINDNNGILDLNLNYSSSLKKELWIFWYEKEEPPNLRSLISPDLYVDSSASGAGTNSTQQQNTSSNNQNQANLSFNSNNNINSIIQSAFSSNNGLPYEARSMLFKALHNLIEKSLIEKGYAKLGKWFVTPYNLR